MLKDVGISTLSEKGHDWLPSKFPHLLTISVNHVTGDIEQVIIRQQLNQFEVSVVNGRNGLVKDVHRAMEM